MKLHIPLLSLLLLTPCASAAGRITASFDSGWRFFKGDIPGAEAPDFNDSKWRRLDVPHDWSIEGPFEATNATGGAGGFLPSGIGWYRKQFSLPEEYRGLSVFVEFDGIMANSDVWINGSHLGKRPSGYVSFSYAVFSVSFPSHKDPFYSIA